MCIRLNYALLDTDWSMKLMIMKSSFLLSQLGKEIEAWYMQKQKERQ